MDEPIESEMDSTRDSVLSGTSQSLSDQPCDGEPELMIIDFEYCAYNYRGFDLANHFLEWTFDYTNTAAPYFYHRPEQYPTREQQVRTFGSRNEQKNKLLLVLHPLIRGKFVLFRDCSPKFPYTS